MTLDLEALVVAAYTFADEYRVPFTYGRPPLVSDAELVALSVAQAAMGTSSDRQFLGLVRRVLPGWFPHLPDQSQYNRRLRGLVELMKMTDRALSALSPLFDQIYADQGHPSIPPEYLLRALLVQVLYAIPSERKLCEHLAFNLLFRWFVGRHQG